MGASKLGRCNLGSYRLGQDFNAGAESQSKSKRSFQPSYAVYSVKIIFYNWTDKVFRPSTKVPTKFTQTEFASTEYFSCIGTLLSLITATYINIIILYSILVVNRFHRVLEVLCCCTENVQFAFQSDLSIQ